MNENINMSNGSGKQKISIDNSKKVNIKIGSTIVIIGLLIVIFFAGRNLLNSPSKQIVGTWETASGFTYVFQSDGQYSHDGGWFGTYSIDGDTLTLCPVLNNPEVYTIDISSKHLTIYDDGEVYRELDKIN